MPYSPGDRWIRFLHGYSPVMENTAMTAEHIDRLEKRTGIDRIRFVHPGYERILPALKPDSGPSRNVILTGTAGDGKTTLCFDLYAELTGQEPDRSAELQTITFDGPEGPRRLTFIYDMTGWREPLGGCLPPAQVDTLAKLARSVLGKEDELFIIAVNDGQLREVFGYVPDNAPGEIFQLKQEISHLHANSIEDSDQHLRLINLSKIGSDLLMARCLDAILGRPEWVCLQTEVDNPLFSERSSIRRNYELLCSKTVRSRLVTLAKLADASGFHMPIRGILCLLVNALLGNPAARDNVLRPQKNVGTIMATAPHEAALHRTLFGDHLSSVTRNKREVYRFLSMLQIGGETTNDLDELLIFGPYDEGLRGLYEELVENDPYGQRNPELNALAREYVRGELSPDDTARLLSELAAERRRLFLTAPDVALEKLDLWRSSVFHHAGEYIDRLLKPLEGGGKVSHTLVQRLVAGLNRVWTGLFITNRPDELYLCTGLDVTTSAVSDILCGRIEILGTPNHRIEIAMCERAGRPEMNIRSGEREFRIALTLTRFEFLCRVADGAMPNSFSRDSAEDFAMLKQRCIATLCPPSNDDVINGIRITPSGKIERVSIHLPQG